MFTLVSPVSFDSSHLLAAFDLSSQYLRDFAGRDDAGERLAALFGNRTGLEAILSQWREGNFGIIPPIEILNSSQLNGANGAFSAQTNRIYLSDAFLQSASVEAIVNLLLEEIGHKVDSVNTVDTAGDEGAIFASLVLGESLIPDELQALQSEDDTGFIKLNREIIGVEMQNFTGTNGNDTITGTSGDDEIYTGSGNDSVNGGAGNDSIYAGSGDDTVNGGDGIDLLGDDFSTSTTNLTFNFASATPVTPTGTSITNIERFELTTGSGNDSITLTGIYSDYLITGAGDDTINPGRGDGDYVEGGDGNDLLIVDYSGNTSGLFGVSSFYTNDYVDGVYYSNIERIQITGTSGDDGIYTGNGDDTVNGGDGDDTLYGDSGSDILNGGSGFDHYDADYSSASTGLLMTFDSATGNGNIVIGNEIDTLISIENFTYFQGTNFDDIIILSSSNDQVIQGNEGNDNIHGNEGNEYLYGDEGDDILNGGKDNDVLYGGTGNDTLYGGLGRAC